jgi:hypothetical protein
MKKIGEGALDQTPVHASQPADQALQHTLAQLVGPNTDRLTLGARGLVSLPSRKLCFSVPAGSAMVSSSLGRLAASQAVGAGGWSYAQIVERLSPAVSKFAVGRAEQASEGARKRPADPLSSASRHPSPPACRPRRHFQLNEALLGLAAPPAWLQEVVADRGSGSYVWTTDGRKHLDMACGIGGCRTWGAALPSAGEPSPLPCPPHGFLPMGAPPPLLLCAWPAGVVSTGHCHPRVVEAIQRQAGQIIMAQQNIFPGSRPMVSVEVW